MGVPRERFARQWFLDPSFFPLWPCHLSLRLPRGVELRYVAAPTGERGWGIRPCHVPRLVQRWVGADFLAGVLGLSGKGLQKKCFLCCWLQGHHGPSTGSTLSHSVPPMEGPSVPRGSDTSVARSDTACGHPHARAMEVGLNSNLSGSELFQGKGDGLRRGSMSSSLFRGTRKEM